VLTRENSVDSISSLHAADSTVSPEKEKLPETASVLSAEPTAAAAAALGVQVESRDLFKPAAALESIESGKSKVNKVLTELMASNDKLNAQKKSIDLLETRLGFFNNAKIAPVLLQQQQQQSESPDLNLMTDYSAVSSPEMNVMSSSRMSIEEPSSCQLDTTTAASKTLFEHISSESCSPIKKPEIDNSAAPSQEQTQPPAIVKTVSRSSSASSLSSTDSSSKKDSNTTSVSVATPPETAVITNCSSLRSSRDSRVSRSSSPLSIGVREENARKERSDRKAEKEQRNSKTSSKSAAAKRSSSSNNNLSSSSQSSLSSSHSLEQQARRPAKHEGRTRERSSDGYGRHRQEEGRGRYEYGEGAGESRSEYKRKKANESEDEGGSSKSRRVSGQKQYAEGFGSQRLEYSSGGGSRFGGQVSRSRVEYGGGRGESSEHRDRYSRSSSQMQQGFGEFRRNRSKEREGEAFLFVGTFLLP